MIARSLVFAELCSRLKVADRDCKMAKTANKVSSREEVNREGKNICKRRLFPFAQSWCFPSFPGLKMLEFPVNLSTPSAIATLNNIETSIS